MWSLRPVLDNGIVAFTSGRYCFCDKHIIAFGSQQLGRRFASTIRKLTKRYSGRTDAELRSEKIDGGVLLTLSLNAPDEVYGSTRSIEYRAIPEWLNAEPELLRRVLRTGRVKVPGGALRTNGFLSRRLMDIGLDLAFQTSVARVSGAKTLVQRPIQEEFLRATNAIGSKAHLADMAAAQMSCEVPSFASLSLKKILKIRSTEYESFLSFRTALRQVLEQQMLGVRGEQGGRELYRDVVEPEVRKLDAHARAIRRGGLWRDVRDVAIGAGVLGFGIFSGLVSADFGSVASAIGGATAVSGLSRLLGNISTPAEVKNSDYYFVWKLLGSKTSRRR